VQGQKQLALTNTIEIAIREFGKAYTYIHTAADAHQVGGFG
jgi:hypothetical protein